MSLSICSLVANQPSPSAELMVIKYLGSPLRVETLSFEEAADFNPQG